MIVGKGLIANSLSVFEDNHEVIIFASGVSNSKEYRKEMYDKELQLINDFLTTECLFVYFSTCSVYDMSLSDSSYVKHKLNIEDYIITHFKKYLILRLPNMIGLTTNNNTFFNYFFNSILNKELILVQKYAVRYFMDVDDLLPILKMLLSNKSNMNQTINVAYNNPIRITEVLSFFEKAIGQKANYRLIESGTEYNIPNDTFINLLEGNCLHSIPSDYTANCIRKYVKMKLVEKLSNQITT